MADVRILPDAKCHRKGCKGKIGYFKDSDEFKCLVCNEPYVPTDYYVELHKDWFKTEKGKKAVRKYRLSEKGKKAIETYTQSVKGKLTLRRYYYSDKGQEAHQRRRKKVKRFKAAERWLKNHPDKTLEDYNKEHPNE